MILPHLGDWLYPRGGDSPAEKSPPQDWSHWLQLRLWTQLAHAGMARGAMPRSAISSRTQALPLPHTPAQAEGPVSAS